MTKIFNKIQMASKMFMEADNRYKNGKRDIDYIVSILLAGAVSGIVGPLVKERGRRTADEILAGVLNATSEPGSELAHAGMFRHKYNSLKHAGNGRKLPASEDLEIGMDVKREAAHRLCSAKQNFQQFAILQPTRETFSPEFLAILQSEEDYI